MIHFILLTIGTNDTIHVVQKNHVTGNETKLTQSESKFIIKSNQTKIDIIQSENKLKNIIQKLSIGLLKNIFIKYINIRELFTIQLTCKCINSLLIKEGIKILSKRMSTLYLNTQNLHNFLNFNYDYANFDPKNVFSLSSNGKCAILTKQENIIFFENPQIDYSQQFLNEIRKTLNDSKSIFHPFKIYDENKNWAQITKDGKIKTNGGNPCPFSELKNVKKIIASANTFAILTQEGNVFCWGDKFKKNKFRNVHDIFVTLDNTFFILFKNQNFYSWNSQDFIFGEKCSKIKEFYVNECAYVALRKDGVALAYQGDWWIFEYDPFRWFWSQALSLTSKLFILENTKMIFTNGEAFTAVGNDGKISTWGSTAHGGHIPKNVKHKIYKKVKMIFYTVNAFAALTQNGQVFSWGSETSGGKIHTKDNCLHNVKMIFSTKRAFAALLNDGSVVAWGDENFGGFIPKEIQNKLKNVKTIVSGEHSFVALLENNGTVEGWGYFKIPKNIKKFLINVKMIFWADPFFLALTKNGNVFGWINENCLLILHDDKHFVENIFPKETAITFIFTNGNVLSLELATHEYFYDKNKKVKIFTYADLERKNIIYQEEILVENEYEENFQEIEIDEKFS